MNKKELLKYKEYFVSSPLILEIFKDEDEIPIEIIHLMIHREDPNEITIFDNLKKCAEYFGLKTPYVLSYCILKSKKKIYKNKYYLNKLRNEKIEV